MEETIETVTKEGLGLLDIAIGAVLPFVPYTQSYGFWFGLILWSLFTIAPWFFMLARLKNMGYKPNRQGIKQLYRELGLITTFSVLTFSVVGILADVIFNLVFGTLIFRELPREGLFTQRVERWDDKASRRIRRWHTEVGSDPNKPPTAEMLDRLRRRERMGRLWAERLNLIMPGHV